MDIKWKIGNRIKQLREEKGIGQRDLALNADLDRSYIAGIESGQRNVSIVNIEKIAAALDVSLKDFFDDEEFNKP
jgi:transcriptional regulator with XRE-family HTH domain